MNLSTRAAAAEAHGQCVVIDNLPNQHPIGNQSVGLPGQFGKVAHDLTLGDLVATLNPGDCKEAQYSYLKIGLLVRQTNPKGPVEARHLNSARRKLMICEFSVTPTRRAKSKTGAGGPE